MRSNASLRIQLSRTGAHDGEQHKFDDSLQLVASQLSLTTMASTGAAAEATSAFMDELPRHAVLVLGVWVVKSEHMYRDDAKNQAQVTMSNDR